MGRMLALAGLLVMAWVIGYMAANIHHPEDHSTTLKRPFNWKKDVFIPLGYGVIGLLAIGALGSMGSFSMRGL